MSAYSMALHPLHPQHAQMLADSGISPARANARGYVTVDTKKRLSDLGIVKAGQQVVPGMLVPMLGVDGRPWGGQYRPDQPGVRDGKIVKYETSARQRNGIDVPPGVGPMLGDPKVPLWITGVDPDGTMPAHEIEVRADHLMRAHMLRMTRAAALKRQSPGSARRRRNSGGAA